MSRVPKARVGMVVRAVGWSGCRITSGLGPSSFPVIPAGVVSRAITWENRKGEPGGGGRAGNGRKGSPCIRQLKNGETATLMDVAGCGVIRHIWITIRDRSRECRPCRIEQDGQPIFRHPLPAFMARGMESVSCHSGSCLSVRGMKEEWDVGTMGTW